MVGKVDLQQEVTSDGPWTYIKHLRVTSENIGFFYNNLSHLNGFIIGKPHFDPA